MSLADLIWQGGVVTTGETALALSTTNERTTDGCGVRCVDAGVCGGELERCNEASARRVHAHRGSVMFALGDVGELERSWCDTAPGREWKDQGTCGRAERAERRWLLELLADGALVETRVSWCSRALNKGRCMLMTKVKRGVCRKN